MPPFFPNYLTVIISNDISFSILLAMMSKLMFLSIFFNSTNKQPLHSAKFSRFLFGYGPLWLSHLFISWMRFLQPQQDQHQLWMKKLQNQILLILCWQDPSYRTVCKFSPWLIVAPKFSSVVSKLSGGLVTKLCPTLVNPWTVACQALSMGFSRWGYWSGLPFPSLEDLPDPGIEPWPPSLQADFLPTDLWGKPLQSLSYQ